MRNGEPSEWYEIIAALLMVGFIWITCVVLALATPAAIVYGIYLLCKYFGHGG